MEEKKSFWQEIMERSEKLSADWLERSLKMEHPEMFKDDD